VRKLGKICVLVVFFFSFEFVDHGGCWGYRARALAQWWHLVASHEAMDALHWVMCIAPYCPGGMAIKIVVDLTSFFVIIDSVVTHNHS
jgi:hypothetical protein